MADQPQDQFKGIREAIEKGNRITELLHDWNTPGKIPAEDRKDYIEQVRQLTGQPAR